MCLGANRWEATKSLRQRCLTAALTQQLNQMGTMGLVTIPGEVSVRCCAGMAGMNAFAIPDAEVSTVQGMMGGWQRSQGCSRKDMTACAAVSCAAFQAW